MVVAVPEVVAVAVATLVEWSKRRTAVVAVAADVAVVVTAAAAAAAAVAAAVAAAAAAAVVPVRFHHVDWEVETCWPRVRPLRPRCCTTLKRGQVSRAPAVKCYAVRYRELKQTLPSEDHPLVLMHPGWEAATRRSY